MFDNRKKLILGILTLEITLVLIISAVIAIFLFQQQARSAKKDLARIQADQVKQIADALNSYTDLYRRELVAPGDLEIDFDNDPETPKIKIPEVATGLDTDPEGSKFTPTVENLIEFGLLPATFSNRPLSSDGRFIIRLTRKPDNCSIANENCRIEGYVTISSPATSGFLDTDAGEFDGDVIGDMLGFMGGNGFATLTPNSDAQSAGGNFTVKLDIDGDGEPEATTPAGLFGMLVGATASRIDIRDPIPDVDFCTGNNLLVGWGLHPNGTEGITYDPPIEVSGAIGGASDCKVKILSDTPVGYRFIQTDADSGSADTATPDPNGPGKKEEEKTPGGTNSNPAGSILLKCVFDEKRDPPAYFKALTSCCDNGNQACSPPTPPPL